MLEHGGNLHDAIIRFGRPREQWIDLSTGINPQSYPVQALPADIWHRLPEPNTELIAAAQSYYKAPHILPVAGSQAAIQALPRLRAQVNPQSRVVMAELAYAEHAHHWNQAGHLLRKLAYEDLSNALTDCDVMVVCNPNNPTGATVAPAVLLAWAEELASRGGWLIVDEAFADVTADLSIAEWSNQPGLIVLRSIGKFFGLAGLRLGFVASYPSLLADLAELIGPWAVSSAAQRIGSAALRDQVWQQVMREQLLACGDRLQALLLQHDIHAKGSALYQWWPEPHAHAFSHCMAEDGIWVRVFTGIEPGIRIGMPPDESAWQRLDQALIKWAIERKKK